MPVAGPIPPSDRPAMDDFHPLHLARTARIVLNGAPDEVFPLFTPLGEREWVPGWAPRLIWPPDGEAAVGAVFLTRAAGELDTIWTMIALEPHERVAYTRITPGSRAGLVEVRCAPEADGKTAVDVTYTYTALSARGNEFLREWTEAEYRRSIEGWRTAINALLAGSLPADRD